MAKGRPKGSRNKPKPDSSNGVGHNSGDDAPLGAELSDDEKQVIWFSAKRRIVDIKEQVAALNVSLRGEFKQLKKDLELSRADVEFALSLDDDDAEETHRRRMMLARWEQHPIGLQADLFGDGVDRTPAVDKAFANGRRHGLAGDPCNPPYDPSSLQYQRFMAGFHEGQAVLAQGIRRPEPPWPDAGDSPAQIGAIGTEPATAQPSGE